MLLNELFLVEYNHEITVKNYGDKLYKHFFELESYNHIQRLKSADLLSERGYSILCMAYDEHNDYDNPRHAIEAESKKILVNIFELMDPTPHKEYTQWLIKNYCKDAMHAEDVATEITDSLEKFDDYKRRRLTNLRDINAYNFRTLYNAFSAVRSRRDDQKQKSPRGDYDEVFRDDRLIVIKPNDREAACFYGQNTRWCTAATNNNMFNSYNQDGPMYIIIPRQPVHTGEKYQFHFPSHQFMDEHDNDISEWGSSLVRRFPELSKIFADQAKEYRLSWLKPPRKPSYNGLNHTKQYLKWKARQLENGMYSCILVESGMFEWELVDPFEELFNVHMGSFLQTLRVAPSRGQKASQLVYAIFPPDFSAVVVVADRYYLPTDGPGKHEIKTLGNADQADLTYRRQFKDTVNELIRDMESGPTEYDGHYAYQTVSRFLVKLKDKWYRL